MRIHETALFFTSLVQDLERLDKKYQEEGSRHFQFDSRWDDKLYSLLLFNFGLSATSSHPTEKHSLKSKFLTALEKRSICRNYQGRIDVFETMLDKAMKEYGEEAVFERIGINASIYSSQNPVEILEDAGIVFKDAKGIAELLQKATEFQEQKMTQRRQKAIQENDVTYH